VGTRISPSVKGRRIEFLLPEIVPLGRHLERSPLHLPDQVTDRRLGLDTDKIARILNGTPT